MSTKRRVRTSANSRRLLLSLALAVLVQPLQSVGRSAWAAPSATAQPASSPRDGQHDFDFNIGSWKTQVSRLQHPLSGSTTWVKYEGTHIVRKVWNGRANLGEIKLDGPAGHLEGLSLRLYNPDSHQWSLAFANPSAGTLGTPLIGSFRNGRGEFMDQEPFNGKAILVRTVWSDITSTSPLGAVLGRRRQDPSELIAIDTCV